MDWAIDSTGGLVRAGTEDAYRPSLRCPVCRASVYHRHGNYNRPHFAHYARNFNLDCENYHPGCGLPRATGLLRPSVPANFGSPALVWRDAHSIPLSLQLRLPKLPKGYGSTFVVRTTLGQAHFSGDDLSRTSFAQLSLQEPPATIDTKPVDLGLMMRVEATLSEFRLFGNYFRATATGGVLVPAGSPLELGEDYFLVSQRPLPLSPPNSLIHTRAPRQHRSWNVYRFLLRDNPKTRTEDIAALQPYLGRSVVPPKPRVDVVWPPPNEFDFDGTPIFSDATLHLVVRSSTSDLHVFTENPTSNSATDLGDGFYKINVDARYGDVIIQPASGLPQYVRFQNKALTAPDGVVLNTSNGPVNLMSPDAPHAVKSSSCISVLVPTELLWRNAKFNGRQLRPIPDDRLHTIAEPLQSLDFGAFGSISLPRNDMNVDERSHEWRARVERLVMASSGAIGLSTLKSVRTKHQALRWASQNNATHILPLILSALSSEENRGIS